MQEAAIPANEAERLAELRKLNILDTPIEERFERITRIVCRSLNVPIAAISLIDESRQWFKSIQGIAVSETPRSVAFCSHAILENDMLVVPDATLDIRFAVNPLVTEDPSIRFYAGQPLTLASGVRAGTLCAIDNKPRTLSDGDAELLRDLAKMVEVELTAIALSDEQIKHVEALNRAQREARIDGLTRLWNRTGIEEMVQREFDFAKRKDLSVALVMVDLDDFKKINDIYGHPVGDEALRGAAQMLLRVLRSYDAVGRWGGDEFMIVLPGSNKEETTRVLRRIQAETNHTPVLTAQGPIYMHVSMGAASLVPAKGDTSEQLIKAADDALLKAKRNGKGRIELAA